MIDRIINILFFLAMMSFTQTIAQEPYTQWLRTFGGPSTNVGRSVLQTQDGNYVVAGTSVSSGYYDVGLYKRDSLGNSIWAKSFGGDGNEEGYSVQQTTDGGFIIVGHTSSFGNGMYDVWLIKTNSSGDTLWTRTYGGIDNDWGLAVRQTSDGGYIIISATISFAVGYVDAWLIKTDSLGNSIWTKTYGGNGEDIGYSVEQTTDGGYIIGGSSRSDVWLIKTNYIGDTIWTRTYGTSGLEAGYTVKQTSDGGYIIIGNSNSFSASFDVWLIKTDSIGDTIWTQTFGGFYDELCSSVQETFDGGYIITGSTRNYGAEWEDLLLRKTDSFGELQWTKTYGFHHTDVGYEVQQTLDGGYIITGVSGSFGEQWDDVILIKLGSVPTFNISVLYPNSRVKLFLGRTEEIHYWTTENIENVKIEFSLDSGDNWNNIINSTPSTGSYSWLVNADSTSSECLIKISDASNNQIFDISDSTFTIDSLIVSVDPYNSDIPIEFSLNQNYPNPFNPTTTINYQIPELSFVTIKVYDVLGNEIVTLVNEEKAVGSYEVEFNATLLPSGVYFYRLQAGSPSAGSGQSFVETKKMVLMK